jgi:hypothetical protein
MVARAGKRSTSGSILRGERGARSLQPRSPEGLGARIGRRAAVSQICARKEEDGMFHEYFFLQFKDA